MSRELLSSNERNNQTQYEEFLRKRESANNYTIMMRLAFFIIIIVSSVAIITYIIAFGPKSEDSQQQITMNKLPLVANTWPWTNATDAGYNELISTFSTLSAIVAGCSYCEKNQCDQSVGWGNSPDSLGNTTLGEK